MQNDEKVQVIIQATKRMILHEKVLNSLLRELYKVQLFCIAIKSLESRNVYNAPQLKKLIDDSLFSDVSFRVGEQTIQAHKNILVSRNDYFRAMFTVSSYLRCTSFLKDRNA